MVISEKEIFNVIISTKEKRLNYFLHRAVPRSSYCISIDKYNLEIEIYPFEEYANYFKKQYKCYKYIAFINNILKNDDYKLYKISIFPNGIDSIIMSQKDFHRLILEEKKRY